MINKLICFLIVAFAVSPVFAQRDSSRHLLASASNAKAGMVLLKKANIIFPTILAEHEAEAIEYVEKYCNNRRDYLLKTYENGKDYFPQAVVILEKYDVPKEFAALMALESSFRGNVVSRAGAVGYWQMMSAAAKQYGLKVGSISYTTKNKKGKKIIRTRTVDERTNLTKSTHAAAKYLQDRQNTLNTDWLLIAASYNCGEGRVLSSMKKSGLENPTFWDIKQFLPAETRSYVMNFIAMNVVFANYKKFAENNMVYEDIYMPRPDATGGVN